MKQFFFLITLLVTQITYSQWEQVGTTLEGAVNGGFFGIEIALSDNGQVMAVGDSPRFSVTTPNPVTIYQRDGNQWIQTTQIFNDFTEFPEQFGRALAISDNGKRLVIGTTRPNSTLGKIQVYENQNGDWVKMGNDIINDTSVQGEFFGKAVAMNGNGLVVATSDPTIATGAAKVFGFQNGNWQQIGDELGNREDKDDSFFGSSLDLSDDGNTLVVGIAQAFTGNGTVEIYRNIRGSWRQIGSPIPGKFDFGQFGANVAITGDGRRLAISAYSNNFSRSYVEVYEISKNGFKQVGQLLQNLPFSFVQNFGVGLDISNDGSVLAIGDIRTINDDDFIFDIGSAYLYQLSKQNEISPKVNTNGNWKLIQEIRGTQENEFLGNRVRLNDSGSLLVVAAEGYRNSSFANVGAVRTYKNTTTVSEPKKSFKNFVSLYPNTFDSNVNLRFTENSTSDVLVKIIDYKGEIVQEASFQKNNTVTIPTNSITNGIYFVQVSDDTGNYATLKAIKQ